MDFPRVPAHIQRKLMDSFGVNAMRNVVLTRELATVLAALSKAGVRAIPLKGLPLAESLFGDAALRTCADVDILIFPENLHESLHRLHSIGYTDRFRRPELVRLLARFGKDCLLIREDQKQVFALQLHCGLIWGGPPERRLLADIWSDAVPRPFHGAPAYAMSPEWEFLYLAIHAARHGLFPYKFLVDIDWLVHRGGLDWTQVRDKAASLGWEPTVQTCFSACARLLDTPIPEPFSAAARSKPVKIPDSGASPLQTPRETVFGLRLLPTLRQKLQFLAIRLLVPTPVDCESISLPSSLFFLYYFLRPWRLLLAVAGSSLQVGMARLRGRASAGPSDSSRW